MRSELIEQFGCDLEDPILSFQGEYRYLSNFWVCEVTLADGVCYNSSEHAFMCQKTTDPYAKIAIRMAPTAAAAKREGRKVMLRPDWEEIKFQAMYDAVNAKFSQNPELKAKLLSTGNRYLEEGNTWNDVVWGVCDGVGTNCLGQILMLVRSLLRETL